MNKNKWLFSLFALSMPLMAAQPVIEAEQASSEIPAPASLSMELDPKFRSLGQKIAYLLMQAHYSHPTFDDNLSK